MSPEFQRLVHLLLEAIRDLDCLGVVMILNDIDTITNTHLCMHIYAHIFFSTIKFF